MVPGEYGFTGMAVSGMLATGLGYSITAVVGFLVFCRRDSLLHFEKPVFRGGVLFHASTNGMSELATSLVSGITALLFVGINVFASGMFTALSNGVVSAVLAFSRSFLFTAASIQLMPVLLRGVTGVWLATPAAELLGTAMAAAVLKYRKRYGY